MKNFYVFTFLCLIFLSCSKKTPVNPPEDFSYQLSVISGNDQAGFQNTQLTEPLVIQLTDNNNRPRGDEELIVSVVQGGGQIVTADSMTNDSGFFVIHWTLGVELKNKLTVTVSEDSLCHITCSATARYLYQPPAQTSDGWETASLSDVGMDDDFIVDLVDSIRTKYYDEVHSVVIVKDDKLVFEAYFPGHDFGYTGANFHGAYINFGRDSWHNTHSATKSIVSALVGIAIDKGFIPNVDEKIFSYFVNYAHLNNSQKDKITIEHLLTMTSGLQWNEWDVSVAQSNHDIVRFNSSSDPIGYLLAKPIVTEPGTSFYYNGAGVDALGEIIRIATGLRIENFSRQYLFNPMGITSFQWQRLSNNLTCAHGDIYIRPRDLAKFGYLFLNNGLWKGNRIISEEWVQKSTQTSISLNLTWADSYGYLWWLKRFYCDGHAHPSFFAEGWGGQKITIFPGLKMVVVFTGANYVSNPPCDEILTRFILRAVPKI